MTRKTLALVSFVLVAVMLVVAVIVGSQLPAGAELPVHWNVQGEVDRMGGKWEVLLVGPVVTALLSLFFYYLPRLEPRQKGLERSVRLYAWGWAAVLMLSVSLMTINVLTALGYEPPVVNILIGAIGLMFILMGNQMAKSRSMYMLGFRTPWTLANEEVWIKTHRLGGKLMVGGGFAMIGAAIASASKPALAVLVITVIILIALVPTVYSYVQWRREMRLPGRDNGRSE
ncbi:SdpI family protein [Sphingosinicella rhizophila]|uniref:SdpI family protein n=1 Tax=Sphingosinicella rhizophila TaxID=3050082 RepID=A0ABU3QAB3_9SPHN|nr:SdpI family protein [Sphingosinicella sp. GR2756]MDT9600339.1 SdpI family protein [Sphingosinicella sp. GR2756]